ncbi:MAG TPA: 30S ribosomal protein S1 [Candidatus Limnocylindria bacterium]
MIDETNRATTGATETPEPKQPGDDSRTAQDSAEQPADEGIATSPAADGRETDAAAAGTSADDALTAPSAEADAPQAAETTEADAPQAAETTEADAPQAALTQADAPPPAPAERYEDAAATIAISVDQGPQTVEPASADAGEPVSAPTSPAETAAPEPARAAVDATAEPEEPMTMAQLMESPDNEVKSLKHGDVVEGTVVRIDPDEILVDFGGKSEGVVSNRELMSRRGPREGEETRPELSVGDEVLVYVLQPESPEGHAVLSLRRAGLERKWRAMQERFEAGEIVEARVIDHNKGGLIVDLGVRGFVPISQIVDFPRRPRDEQPRDAAQEIAEKLQPFVGRTLRLKILEVNRKANRLILSEKVALYEERREKRDELFSSLQVGQRVTGVVRSIAPFGVFVDLGGIDGLVHKSELSWNKVNNPESAYQMGDEVEAEVIDINHERGRISLSIRRLQADPWQESVAKYKIGDVIDGTVTKLVNFGAFVRVEEGLEGLIHISELSSQRVAHPGDVVQEGQQVKLRIISLDSERHRLGLSLKQAEDRPAPAAREERPRRERTSSNRRDRPEYRPEDATAEPEGGIDSTMAAAFASSGLLDQFRASQEGSAEAPTESHATAATEASGAADAAAEADATAATVEAPAPNATALEDDLRATDAAAQAAGDEAQAAKAEPVADEPDDASATDGAEAEDGKAAKAGRAVKAEKAEKAEKADKAEKAEKPEKAEKADKKARA